MTTPAERAGFALGRKYKLTEDDSNYSGWKKGTVLTFERDDDTDIPVFKNEAGDKMYVPLYRLQPEVPTGLLFEEKEVTTSVTVIHAGKALSKAAKDAIAAIIEGDK